MSCLFRSLSYFITNVQTEELRNIITDYIEKDPILIAPDGRLSTYLSFDKRNLTDYTREMRKSSTWGGAIEIRAFCELFKIKVFVYVIRDNKFIEFVPSNYTDNSKFIKISWNGSHYEPIKN
jgi:hypothetical protein